MFEGVYATLVLYFSESVLPTEGSELQEGLIPNDWELRCRPIFCLSHVQRVLFLLVISFSGGSNLGSSSSMLFWAKLCEFSVVISVA